MVLVRRDHPDFTRTRRLLNIPDLLFIKGSWGTFSGVAGIYQRHRYAEEAREAFELWSQHIEALTTKKAVAA